MKPCYCGVNQFIFDIVTSVFAYTYKVPIDTTSQFTTRNLLKYTMKMVLCAIVFTLSLITLWQSSAAAKSGRFFINRPGNFVLGGLFPLHRRGINENECGEFQTMPGYHYLEAMLYAIDKINNDTTILPNITLGARIYDSCHSQIIGAKMTKELITMTLVPQASGDQLVGVIGAHSSELSKIVADFLRVFKIPQISYGSTATSLSNKDIFSYFFRTVPSDTWQARAIADVIVKLGWNFVITIHSDGLYGKAGMEDFHKAAMDRGICIALTRSVSSFPTAGEFDRLVDDLNQLIDKQHEQEPPGLEPHAWGPHSRGVVLFTLQRDSRLLLEALARKKKSRRFFWIASDSWGNNVDVADRGLEDWAEGAITVSQLNKPVPGFEEYFRGLNANDKRLLNNEWFRYFWQSNFNCSLNGSSLSIGKNCSGNESLSHDHSAFAPVQTVVNAVYAMAHALHDYVNNSCTRETGTCSAVPSIKRDVLYRYLRNTTFKDQTTGQQVYFDTKQDISTTSYSIFNFQKTNGKYNYKNVGTWRGVGKLELNMTELRWPDGSIVPPSSFCSEACANGSVRERKGEQNIACCWNCVACAPRDVVVNNTCVRCRYGHSPDAALEECVKFPVVHVMSKSSSKAILAVSVVGFGCVVVVAAIFLKYSHVPLIKASSRELSGIILFGLALLFTFPWLLLSEPSRTICVTRIVLLGVALASCYAPLFMKILRIYRIFTSARKSVNKPFLVSPASQVFIATALIMIQCLFGAISFFSDIPAPAEREMASAHEILLECSIEKKMFASLLSYNMLLMAMCTVIAFKTRGFPRNFNEAKYIGFTMYFTCFVWIIFFPFYLSSGDGLVRLYWEAVAVLSIAWITLLGLFGPKIYLLYIGHVSSEYNDQLAVTSNSVSEASVLRVDNTITPLNSRKDVDGNVNGKETSVSNC